MFASCKPNIESTLTSARSKGRKCKGSTLRYKIIEIILSIHMELCIIPFHIMYDISNLDHVIREKIHLSLILSILSSS